MVSRPLPAYVHAAMVRPAAGRAHHRGVDVSGQALPPAQQLILAEKQKLPGHVRAAFTDKSASLPKVRKAIVEALWHLLPAPIFTHDLHGIGGNAAEIAKNAAAKPEVEDVRRDEQRRAKWCLRALVALLDRSQPESVVALLDAALPKSEVANFCLVLAGLVSHCVEKGKTRLALDTFFLFDEKLRSRGLASTNLLKAAAVRACEHDPDRLFDILRGSCSPRRRYCRREWGVERAGPARGHQSGEAGIGGVPRLRWPRYPGGHDTRPRRTGIMPT